MVQAVELGALVGVRPDEVVEAPNETTRRRAVVSELQGFVRGLLALRGDRYLVTTDVDLERLPDRREFDVVPRAKAEVVLEELARPQRGRFVALLTEVRSKLTADWTAPLTPDGFDLLRLRLLVRVAKVVEGAASTPSAMRDLVKSQETTWIEIVLEDQDGEPVRDAAVVLNPGGRLDLRRSPPRTGCHRARNNDEAQAPQHRHPHPSTARNIQLHIDLAHLKLAPVPDIAI